MPYRWEETGKAPDQSGAFSTVRLLRLWPHRAMNARGFATFITATALLFAVPLLSLSGRPALWFVFVFAALAVWAIWTALRRNASDLSVTEELILTGDRITLTHRPAKGPEKLWSANSHWVRVTLYADGGPVADYLTLSAEGREVELGRFLTPGERRALADDLRHALSAQR